MGFFNKLFGKKKQDDDISNLLKQISSNQNSISTSPNYQSVFFGLKGMYFANAIDFMSVASSEKNARVFLKEALDWTKAVKKIAIPQAFYDMPIHIYPNKGIIFEIPNPRFECECNYVALICAASKKMFTNEYYASNRTFGLCCVTDTMHMILRTETDTFEKFVKATIGY